MFIYNHIYFYIHTYLGRDALMETVRGGAAIRFVTGNYNGSVALRRVPFGWEEIKAKRMENGRMNQSGGGVRSWWSRKVRVEGPILQ